MTPQDALKEILAGRDLSREVTEELFGDLMDGRITETMKAALLIGLAMKGEAPAEIAGAAAAMRRRVIKIPHGRNDVIDTCGTGGDGRGTFNVSTCAALIAAGAGARVAKHGNRSVSSRSGSADVLQALGVSIELGPEQAAQAVNDIGIAFLFAPLLHPAMKEAMPVRRELAVRTIFNVLGPLTNPAGARRQVVGVYAEPLVDKVAWVLRELGSDHALVVHGDGLDEITTTGPTRIAEVRGDQIRVSTFDPAELGLARARAEELRGGSPEENARVLRRVLEGEAGKLADLSCLNAGAALVVAGLAEDLRDGLALARLSIASGAANAKLDALSRYRG